MKKGSPAAKKRMAELRAMRKGTKKKPAEKTPEKGKSIDPGPGRFLVG